MGRRRSSAVNKLFAWVRRQSMKVKIFLAVTSIISSLVALRLLVKDTNQFFVASESVHAAGIIVLIYKLSTQKTCSGLSLQTQELTAIFLAVRLFCSFMMEHDIHTVLDFATLVSTLWVIYMIRFKLKTTYNSDLDSMPKYYLIVPCAILALLIYPHTFHSHLSKVMWAFCVYLEAIAVVPQLIMMQKTKMIEPSTAHYVFALGVARFWDAHTGSSRCMNLLARICFYWEAVTFGCRWCWWLKRFRHSFWRTFCYYYVKSVVNGQLLVSLPPV